jgi:hypothetical protein
MKCECGTEKIDAGYGIGFYCPNPECGHLDVKAFKKMLLAMDKKNRKVCDICGERAKKPTAKYCITCSHIIQEEFNRLSKEAWSHAIGHAKKVIQERKSQI